MPTLTQQAQYTFDAPIGRVTVQRGETISGDLFAAVPATDRDLFERSDASEPVDATDAAIELAKEHDIDLAEAIRNGSLEGTGSDGRILLGDVEALVDE